MAISAYSISRYWWFLMTIMLMDIDDYSISGYW